MRRHRTPRGDIQMWSLAAEDLAANDRIKVRVSVPQAAARYARDPDQRATDLTVESRTVEIAPAAPGALIAAVLALALPQKSCKPPLI
jgi:hypothetical protein